MKRFLMFLLCLCLGFGPACAESAADEPAGENEALAVLVMDLALATQDPSDENTAQLEEALSGTDDPVALAVADHWKKVWMDPDYRLCLNGTDDPAELPVTGRHAFVVLGYALVNGQITSELAGRCEAAAAAARAFPDSILVCSGGATGGNNPDGHTEAGIMKEYLTQRCGIAAERIFTDERSLTTADNARYTLDILQEQGIGTITIITSAYHQKRGQTLFNALAALRGYPLEIIGNFNYDMKTNTETERSELLYTLFQLIEILELPGDAAGPLRNAFYGN